MAQPASIVSSMLVMRSDAVEEIPIRNKIASICHIYLDYVLALSSLHSQKGITFSAIAVVQ